MDTTNIKKQVLISRIPAAVISVIHIGISAVTYVSIRKAQRQEAKQYPEEIVTQYKNMLSKRYGQDVSDETFLVNALQGERAISDIITDDYTGNGIL